MSISKDRLAYRELVLTLLQDIKAVKCCDAHDDYRYRTCSSDNESVYAKVTSIVKQTNDYSFYSDMKELHAAIKEVLDDLPDSSKCPYCEKAFNE